ncbi:hypothetical protein WL40_02435 [Burkholderia ubonensis]|uniref:hypothetical protein n=1 Tax=Burkholderia ubonensis TaxID=101571 RepID=UPI00075EFD35|nr:hypothetical protein [Burkholderia ubonensis]KVM14175.1 hypothetical protein WJ51_14555 [Burkholderia ubonensis]KVM20127.1 hypothetical protein WJ52_06375 [Burkholderia ubonensis]KVM41440.1 hypothetical protein WJ56_32855 [Burkholderia ubonensis]KVO16841.1 hypothetical protein WJ73_09435 [Burkholderia ubonensis]KVP56816.1 hypothetical protein WJ92_13965 [Burkholderia ubonensis]
MVRLIGCGLLALACTTPGVAADHYVEVWNPPEARTAAPRPPAAHTPDAHAAAPAKHAAAQPKAVAKAHKRHVAPATQTLKTGAHRMPAPATSTAPATRPVAQPAPGRLTVMQPDAQDSPHGLAFTDIPRQYTPDGNVLRVGTRNGPAKVTR